MGKAYLPNGSFTSTSPMPRMVTYLTRIAFIVFLVIVMILSIWPVTPSQTAHWKMISSPFSSSSSSSSSAAASGRPGLSKARQSDLTMSQSVCRSEFPLLYHQLDQNAQAWKLKGGINSSHLQDSISHCQIGCVRLIIKDGRIFIRNYQQGMQSRIRGIMGLFKSAIESATMEDKERWEGLDLVFNAFDKNGFGAGDGSGWVLTKLDSDAPGQYLLPDFSFAAWPEAGIASYNEFRRDAQEINDHVPWEQKGNRAFFRGDPNVGSSGSPARFDLMKQVKQPGAEAWADVQKTSFDGSATGTGPMVTISEHCRHKYLLHAEGASYSGRSKFVLGCGSAVLTHNLIWTQSFHPALISESSHPDQNLIVIPGKYFEKLAETVGNLLSQEVSNSKASLGRIVASNAQRTLSHRYLTPAAQMCYIRGALLSYSSVLNRQTFNNGNGPDVIRGGGVVPFSGTRPIHELKGGIKGDIEVTTWQLLDHPEWPPR